jgi:hypothetical protein
MWPRIPNILVGVWLMAAPALLSYGGAAATNDRVIGPLAITFATIAIWESTRSVRLANVVLGAWQLLAPWILMYGSTPATVSSTVAGVLLISFGLIEGARKQRFDGGWRAIWRPENRTESTSRS